MRELVCAMECPESETSACQEARRANGVRVIAESVESMCKNLTQHSAVCAGLAVRALYVVVANRDQGAGRNVEAAVAKGLTSSLLAYLHWANAHLLGYQSVHSAVCLLLAIIDDDLGHAREVAAGGGASLCLDLMPGVGGKRDALCRLLCLVFEEGADANSSKNRAFVNAELRRGTPQRIVACVLEMQNESNEAKNEKGLANLYAALNVVSDSERGMDALLATELWASIADNACRPRSCTLLDVAVIMMTAKMLMRDEALAPGLFYCLQGYCDRVIALCQENPEDKRLQVASVSIFKVLAQARVKLVHECGALSDAQEPWVTEGRVVPFVRSVMQRQDLGEASSSVMLALLRQLYHLHGRKWAVGADGGIAELLALLHTQNPAQDLLSAICALFALTRNSYQNKLRFFELGGVRTVLDLCEQNKVHNDTVKVVCEILQVMIMNNRVRRKFVQQDGLRFANEAFRQVGATWGPVTLVLKLLCMSTFPRVPQIIECGLFRTIVEACERRDLTPENAFGLLVFLQWVCAHPASAKHAEQLRVRQTALGVLRRFSDDKNVVDTTILLNCSMYVIEPKAFTEQEFGELVLRPNVDRFNWPVVSRGLKLARLVATHEVRNTARDYLWLEVMARLAKLASCGTWLHDMWYPVLVLAAELVGKHVDERALKHVRIVVAAFSEQSDDEPLMSNRLGLFHKLQAWVLEREERERARERLAEEMFASLMLEERADQQPARPVAKKNKRGKRRQQSAAGPALTDARADAASEAGLVLDGCGEEQPPRSVAKTKKRGKRRQQPAAGPPSTSAQTAVLLSPRHGIDAAADASEAAIMQHHKQEKDAKQGRKTPVPSAHPQTQLGELLALKHEAPVLVAPAAGVGANFTGAKPSTPPSADMECVVCMEHVKTHALVPCYHMCVCAGCAEYVVEKLGTCPLCSASAARAQRVWV